MLRRSIFILSLSIIALSAPVGFMVIDVSAEDPPPAEESAEEYIPEGDPTPPPVLTVQNPELVVVPSGETQVYMVPNMVGVYFYDGFWYRHHHGVWFRANVYNEPWVAVQMSVVPSFVVGISPAYAFYLPRDYHRIRYSEFHSHWRTWDREKHWRNERWFKNERRAEVRHDRERQAHTRMEKDRHLRQERVKSDRVGYKNRLADPGRHNKLTPSGHAGPQRSGQPGHVGSQRPGQQPKSQVQQRRQQQSKPQAQQRRQQQQPKSQAQQGRQQQSKPQAQQGRQQQSKPQAKPQQKSRDDKQDGR